MKSFNRLLSAVIAMLALMFFAANVILGKIGESSVDKQYLVDISRASRVIAEKGLEGVDLSDYSEIDSISICDEQSSFDFGNSYAIRKIKGELYRFDYTEKHSLVRIKHMINIILAIISVVFIGTLLFVRFRILKPFDKLKNVPYELSKGNLTVPVKETKNKFFGKFIWGVDLLREKMEMQKQNELELQKEKKTLMLSLSHDIKTPLSAIKLYSKALSKGLYTDKEKQLEVAESINAKADEIEHYISQIINASREDFLSLEVNMGEFYISDMLGSIAAYYTEKMSLIKTDFSIGKYSNCFIKGDLDRGIEVLQNIIENAIKYGDGHFISVGVSEEDGCILITVTNSGCTLGQEELPHIFESFLRGKNSDNIPGSGLGLYICRQLMTKMEGDIFAEIKDNCMNVTAVFAKV